MKKTSIIRLMTIITSFVLLMGNLPQFSVSAAYENTHVNTGNYAYDIVQVAKTQVGYVEGTNNDTKYNRWFGSLSGYGYNYAWCQTFVAWCANQAGVPTSMIPRVSGTISAKDTFKKNGTYHAGPYEGGSYTPKAGDIIYFYSSGSSSKHHVGIVSGCSNGTVYTIEGNSSNKVAERSYSVNYGNIRGYGVPFSEPVPPVELVTPTIHTDKSSYTVGETVNISWEASPAGSNLSHYWLNIAGPNGEYPYSGTMNLNTSYSFVASQAGNYTITTYATPKGSLNGEGSLTDTKTISVENKPIILNASVTSLDLKQNESETITISCANYPDNIYLKYEYDNDSILKCTWGDWSGDTVPLTIEGKNAGTEIITVTMRDSNSNNVLATIKVNVSVKSNQCYVQLYDGNRLLADYSLPYGFELNDFYLPNLEKDGFTFVGWYTAGGTEYSIGSKVPEIPELSLYARCKENKCIVKWDTNIEGFPNTYTEYRWGEKFGDAAENIDAEPSGCFFEGWYTSREDGKLVTSETLVPEKNEITLYAHWRMEDVYLYARTIELTLDELIASDYKVKVPIVIRGTSGSNVQNSIGWDKLGYGASWNTEELTALNVEGGDAIRDVVVGKAINNDKGLMWSAVTALSGKYIQDGIVSYITFDVNPSASAGDVYKVQVLTKGEATQGFVSTNVCDSIHYIGYDGAIIIKDNQLTADLNQDGSVTILDAVLLQKHLLNFKKLTTEQMKLADINSDGRVNILDMSLLKEKLK